MFIWVSKTEDYLNFHGVEFQQLIFQSTEKIHQNINNLLKKKITENGSTNNSSISKKEVREYLIKLKKLVKTNPNQLKKEALDKEVLVNIGINEIKVIKEVAKELLTNLVNSKLAKDKSLPSSYKTLSKQITETSVDLFFAIFNKNFIKEAITTFQNQSMNKQEKIV